MGYSAGVTQSPQDWNRPVWPQERSPQVAPAQHGLATVAFVLGILSVVGMPFVGPVAWALGRRAVREIDTRPELVYGNRGIALTGMILGIVGSVMLLLAVVAVLAVVALLVAASA